MNSAICTKTSAQIIFHQQDNVKYVGRVPSEELINNISKKEKSAGTDYLQWASEAGKIGKR